MTRHPLIAHAITALCTVLVSATPASAAGTEDRVVISNLAYGEICWNGDVSRICKQTGDIALTDNSTCIYDHKQIACTWYGYAFDYELPSDQVVLNCRWSSNIPGDVGNPDGIKDRNAISGTYELTLRGRSGHFENPQYSGVQTVKSDLTEETQNVCYYGSQKLFQVTLLLHRPTS